MILKDFTTGEEKEIKINLTESDILKIKEINKSARNIVFKKIKNNIDDNNNDDFISFSQFINKLEEDDFCFNIIKEDGTLYKNCAIIAHSGIIKLYNNTYITITHSNNILLIGKNYKELINVRDVYENYK